MYSLSNWSILILRKLCRRNRQSLSRRFVFKDSAMNGKIWGHSPLCDCSFQAHDYVQEYYACRKFNDVVSKKKVETSTTVLLFSFKFPFSSSQVKTQRSPFLHFLISFQGLATNIVIKMSTNISTNIATNIATNVVIHIVTNILARPCRRSQNIPYNICTYENVID